VRGYSDFTGGTMLIFTLNYGKKDENGVLRLSCPELGEFPILTGKMPYTDIPECTFKPLSALPEGRYWIVERPDGNWKNKIRSTAIDIWKTGTKGENTPPHTNWFGLFNAESMTDSMFIDGTERGYFRLHPLNGDGSGVSEGCIAFYLVNDFNTVRRALLAGGKTTVNNGSGKRLDVYGHIDVVNISSFQNSYSGWSFPFSLSERKHSPERPVYDLLTREIVCSGAKKEDALKYGEKKITFEKQIKQEASEELYRLLIERKNYKINNW
jgi:hypothetical protein